MFWHERQLALSSRKKIHTEVREGCQSLESHQGDPISVTVVELHVVKWHLILCGYVSDYTETERAAVSNVGGMSKIFKQGAILYI